MPTTTTESPTTAALIDLDKAAKAHRTARDVVDLRVSELDAEIADLYRRKLPGIRTALAAAQTTQDAAVAAVLRHPEMFPQKKRTMVLRGIKLGFTKGGGRVEWEAEDATLIERIEKMFKGDDTTLALLINTTKTPSKDALKQLEADVLAKLGVTVEGVGDFVVVSDSDSAAKKLVKRILKDGAVHETTTKEGK